MGLGAGAQTNKMTPCLELGSDSKALGPPRISRVCNVRANRRREHRRSPEVWQLFTWDLEL